MPRIKALRIDYMKVDAIKLFKIKMIENNVLQRDLAKVIGLSPSAFSIRFRNFDFDYEHLVKMIKKLNFSNEEIIKLMQI